MITTPHTTIKTGYRGLCDHMPHFCEEVGQHNLLMLIQHGSHLYGTDTPTSDMDLKGVFMPSVKQIMLGKIPKCYNYQSKKDSEGKNTENDIDVELFSLHYFIELACKGETISIDMLHATDAIVWTAVWNELYEQRARFYTKDMRAFVGYARTQAAKYGIKGSRLDAVKKVVDFLDGHRHCDTDADTYFAEKRKLKDLWGSLPTGEHIHFLEPNPRDKNGNQIYQVCGKQLLESMPVEGAYICLNKFYNDYGKRAKLAQQNEGIDWKAVSHALRAAAQIKEIFVTGDLKFPLVDREYLKAVKQGRHPWANVQQTLENDIEFVERLSAESVLPSHPNRREIDAWLYGTVVKAIG